MECIGVTDVRFCIVYGDDMECISVTDVRVCTVYGDDMECIGVTDVRVYTEIRFDKMLEVVYYIWGKLLILLICYIIPWEIEGGCFEHGLKGPIQECA
jgi:hypothetical protein